MGRLRLKSEWKGDSGAIHSKVSIRHIIFDRGLCRLLYIIAGFILAYGVGVILATYWEVRDWLKKKLHT